MDGKGALERIAHGTVLAFAGIFISKIFGYVYRLVAARFGAADYGLLSLGLALFNVLMIVALLGLNQGALRYVSFYRGKGDSARVKGTIVSSLLFSGLFSVVVAVALFFLSDWIALVFFGEPRLGLVFKILAFVIPFDVLRNVLFNVIRGFENVTYEIYARNIAENVVKVLVTVVLFLLGLKLLGATVAFSVAIVVSFVMAAYYGLRFLKAPVRAVAENRELLLYSVPLVLNNLAILVMLWTDTLMIGYFRTAAEVGVYNAAGPTASLTYLVPQALLSLFLPVLTGLYALKKMDDFKAAYRSVLKWVMVANVALASVFLLVPGKVLTMFFGAEYAAGAAVLVVLSLGYFVYYLALVANNILLIYERTRVIFVASALGCVVNVGMNVVLIPKYGIVGAALATGLAYVAVSVVFFVVGYKLTGVRVFGKDFLKVLVGGLVSSGVGYGVLLSAPRMPVLVEVALVSVVFVLVYLVMLLVLRVVEEPDLVLLRELERRAGVRLRIVRRVLRRFVSR